MMSLRLTQAFRGSAGTSFGEGLGQVRVTVEI